MRKKECISTAISIFELVLFSVKKELDSLVLCLYDRAFLRVLFDNIFYSFFLLLLELFGKINVFAGNFAEKEIVVGINWVL